MVYLKNLKLNKQYKEILSRLNLIQDCFVKLSGTIKLYFFLTDV